MAAAFPACLGMVLPLVGYVLPHQSSSKTVSYHKVPGANQQLGI